MSASNSSSGAGSFESADLAFICDAIAGVRDAILVPESPAVAHLESIATSLVSIDASLKAITRKYVGAAAPSAIPQARPKP